MSHSHLIWLTLLCCLVAQQTLCQDVEPRMSEKSLSAESTALGGSGGGQSRSIYSQKHLSPHRMMHFGKRPLTQMPPSVQVLDLFEPQEVEPIPAQRLFPAQQLQPLNGGRLPFSMYFNMPSDQTLELLQDPLPKDERIKQLLETIEQLITSSRQQGCEPESQLLPKGSQIPQVRGEFMKLTKNDGHVYDLSEGSTSKRQQSAQLQDSNASGVDQAEVGGQQEQQRPQDPINLVGRSLPNSRNDVNLSKAYISNILFGRRMTEPPSSLTNLGSSFAKKTEPSKMTFMHFG